jgi:dihydrofolate reductase
MTATYTATYTWDVFSTLDGFGSYSSSGDWGGYWGKQGPEFIARRLALYGGRQRLAFGANTYRQFVELLGVSAGDDAVGDPSEDPNARIRNLPLTVVSTTLDGPLDWPGGGDLISGDAVEVIARLKRESEVPVRSHGSLSMNRALMAAGLVDRIQLTIFPVITGRTGAEPIFHHAADFDLELIESRTLDTHIQELTYRPTLHA